jgi:hypothetical protein
MNLYGMLILHCNSCSIWTVDLAHLLRRFDVDVLFLTVTIGANPKYVDETFYKVLAGLLLLYISEPIENVRF